ncbi:hypothetical protein CSPX01_04436 [Colletotrichum filicis]|nr:hypothetical protein CSPX01_04436 [Colletotrichum filicis]
MLLLTFRTAGIGTTTCIDQRFGNLEISTVTSKFPWLGLQLAPVVCVYLSIPDGGLKLSAGPFVHRSNYPEPQAISNQHCDLATMRCTRWSIHLSFACPRYS